MSGEEPAAQMAPVESPQIMSSVKLPILKKGEYTLWSMWIEKYLTNTDYALWEIIMNGDDPVHKAKGVDGVESSVTPKTAQAIQARQKERKAKSFLVLDIHDEYQLRFHTIKDAKSLWAAIKKGLDKAYDRPLPLSWNNIALIMSKKEGVDELDIYDLYNNLKVFEADIKRSTGSSSKSKNVAFLSTEDTNSINEVNNTNGVSTEVGHSSPCQTPSSLYANDLMFSFFANQLNSPQLDDEDLELIDHDDLEEMDLKWQVAMLFMRVKRFYKKTGRKLNFNSKDPIGFDKTKDNALFVQDGLRYDWSYIAQDKPTKFAFMAYTSGSNTELNETLKEKEDLKAKLEQFETSSKNLSKLIKCQLSTKDKTVLGYGDQLSESDSEVPTSIFDSRLSDGDDNQANDRFKKGNEYHAIPPPLTGNYMPPLANLSFARLDDSFYRPIANKTSASTSQDDANVTQTSNISVETEDQQTTVKPSFKKIDTTTQKAINTPK
ncbi:hypothetical protein Tco_0117415 [Tanacetum coccineum]